MKVLFIHRNRLGAFGEAAMHYFPSTLARLGHQISIIGMAGGDAGGLRGNGIAVYEIGVEESWGESVKRIIGEQHPDIVHVYLYSGCGMLPLLLRRISPDTRFVLDIRSPLLRTGLARLMHRAKNLVEPLGFDAIAAHGLESARTQLGRLYRNIHWLPPGVDFSLIPDVRDDVEEAKRIGIRLVYIGSMDAIRRVDRMLEAVMEVAGNHDVFLDLYGDGDQAVSLMSRVKQAGLEQRIRFMGKVDRSDLMAALQNYDIGLAYIPGGIYDTAPALKTLEYLACGLPVLATDTLGNRMFVQHEKNGFLVDSDAASFAHGLREMIGKGNLRAMRARARASVKSFDWMHITRERLLPLYESLLSEGKG